MLMIPYHKNGTLMLGTFPGMKSQRHVVTGVHHVPTLELIMDLEKEKKKPDTLTHLAIYTAGIAIGYELRGGNLGAENKAEWFTPQVLRAARVFLKDLSTAQYTNQGASEVTKPGFVYYPVRAELLMKEIRDDGVHLVFLGLQVAQIQWAVMRKLPFYVRGLLREGTYWIDTRGMHYCCLNRSRHRCDYGSASHVVGKI